MELILQALLAKAKKGDVRAAELLLERAYGKTKQPVEMKINRIGLDAENIEEIYI